MTDTQAVRCLESNYNRADYDYDHRALSLLAHAPPVIILLQPGPLITQ